MAELFSVSWGLLTLAVNVGYGFLGNAAYARYREFLLRWQESGTDPATGLPRNRELHDASLDALREAAQVLVMELAGRLDPTKPWLPRLIDHVRAGNLFKTPLFEAGRDPKREWVEALRAAIANEHFAEFHDRLVLNEGDVQRCVAGDCCSAFGEKLAGPFLDWARRELRTGQADAVGQEPPDFEPLVRQGWQAGKASGGAVTLGHAYCLFFREHLRRDPGVFRKVVANTLGGMRSQLDGLGTSLTGELQTLRDQIAQLAAAPPDLAAFQRWLDPQLGALNDLLAEVKGQLDAVAQGQRELANQQGEILVAIATLCTELVRGSDAAQTALSNLADFLAQFERKLDYLLAGLPIQRFEVPDPPSHELELLHAKHRAVDLVSREKDLEALSHWLVTPKPISARLLVGGAGTGKTRLAFELLLRTNAELPDWQAGVLTGSALRKFDATKQQADWSWAVPTLVVVDHAQTLAGPLAELLRALTHKRRSGLPPLRLLLLERQAGDWFDDLLREEDSTGPCAVRRLFDPPQPVPLTPIPRGRLRRQVLDQTLAKAAEMTGKAAPALPPESQPDFAASLNRDIFTDPLNLMLAALAAGELGLQSALNRSRIELAQVLAEKELRRVERFARNPEDDAQKRALRHLTACATLVRGFTAGELDRALAEELDALRLVWPGGPGDLAQVLRRALPGEDLAVAPVEPDFVGEALVLAALARPDARKNPDRWHRWCSTVERCCRRQPLATPATLLHAFQNFGLRAEFGEPLLAATDALIRTGLADAGPTLLLGIENALPHQTVELRFRAAEVTGHLHARLKAALVRGRNDLASEVARLANNLAIRLSKLNRRIEALALAHEATQLYRALVARNPGAFTPDLAMSLNNLAIRLSELGRRAEALAPAQESVERYRQLV